MWRHRQRMQINPRTFCSSQIGIRRRWPTRRGRRSCPRERRAQWLRSGRPIVHGWHSTGDRSGCLKYLCLYSLAGTIVHFLALRTPWRSLKMQVVAATVYCRCWEYSMLVSRLSAHRALSNRKIELRPRRLQTECTNIPSVPTTTLTAIWVHGGRIKVGIRVV